MRLCRTFGTSVIFLSAVCWSSSDVVMPHHLSANPEHKAPVADILEKTLVNAQLRQKNVLDHSAKKYSYPFKFQAFGSDIVAQMTTQAGGIQHMKIDLTNLQHLKSQVSEDFTYLEKALSLLAVQSSSVEISFNAATQNVSMTSGNRILKTEIVTSDAPRHDLPVLLEEDAAKQIFLALECEQTVFSLSEGEAYPCYSGSLLFQEDNLLTFEPNPEYLPAPAILETQQTNSTFEFPLSSTTQVVLTLNRDGTIAWGNTFSTEEAMDSGTPRTVNKGKKSRRNKKGGGSSSGKTVIYSFNASSVSNQMGKSGMVGGGAGGEPPEDPSDPGKTLPSDLISFSEEDENEEGKKTDDTSYTMADYFDVMTHDDQLDFLSSKKGKGLSRESGYNSGEDTPEDPKEKERMSQWGDGQTKANTPHKHRGSVDYMGNGRDDKYLGTYKD